MAKNNKKSTLLPNMTIQEASEFWDEHSLLEFDDTEEVEVKFKLKKNSISVLTVRYSRNSKPKQNARN